MDKNENLVAPCGMNCGICSGYLAETHDIKKQGVRMTYCRGCRPRNKNCAFLKKRCRLLSEGTVNFCYECPQFPCDQLKAIDKRYRERYHMSMLENLSFIREHGIDGFLKKKRRNGSALTAGEQSAAITVSVLTAVSGGSGQRLCYTAGKKTMAGVGATRESRHNPAFRERSL